MRAKKRANELPTPDPPKRELELAIEETPCRRFMLTRFEGLHPLEHPILKIATTAKRNKPVISYKCPLCEPTFTAPRPWIQLLTHYLETHWHPRQYLGHLVCFPCCKFHLDDQSGKPHFHCPAKECIETEFFAKFVDLQLHCLSTHFDTLADPLLTPLSPTLLHAPFLEIGVATLPLANEDEQPRTKKRARPPASSSSSSISPQRKKARRVHFSDHVTQMTFDKEASLIEKCGSCLGPTAADVLALSFEIKD